MLTATGLPVTRMERHDAAAARMIDQIAAPAHRRPADRARPGGGAWPRLRPGRTGARRREDRNCRGHHRIRPAGRGETGVSRDDHDLVVIGGGLGAARAAVHRCAATLLVSDGEPGGDCTYCAPSKTLIESARRGLPFTTAAQPVRDVVAAIAATENAAALRGEGIDVALGRAASTAPGRITVAGRPISARRFVVATGSRPLIPPIPGFPACRTSPTSPSSTPHAGDVRRWRRDRPDAVPPCRVRDGPPCRRQRTRPPSQAVPPARHPDRRLHRP